MKTMVDLFLRGRTRISYRRLLCFFTATALLLADKLVASDWIYIAIAFIAGEALPKMAEAYQGGQAFSNDWDDDMDMVNDLYGGMDDMQQRLDAMTRGYDAGTLDPHYSDEDTGEYGTADASDETP